jgi:hypothetical protein
MIWSGYGQINFAQLAPMTSTTGGRSSRAAPPSDPDALRYIPPTRTAPTLAQTLLRAAPTITAGMPQNLIRLASVSNVPTTSENTASTADALAALFGGRKPGAEMPGTVNGPSGVPYEIKQQCASVGGQWQVDGCVMPDGAKVAPNAKGEWGCVNTQGVCAGEGEAKPKMGTAMMIGGAALAALLLLR